MAEVIRNDAGEVVARGNQGIESLSEFQQATRRLGELAQAGTGMEGQAQIAFAAAGQRLADSGDRFHGRTLPRLEAVVDSAAANTGVAEDSAGALSAIDVDF